MASLKEIFSWFKKNDYPTEQQFQETWKSFWHKSERINQTSVLGLSDALNNKADKSELTNVVGGLRQQGSVTNMAELNTITIKVDGDAYIVESEKDEYGNPYIFRWTVTKDEGGNVIKSEWVNTKLTTFPKDVALTGGSTNTIKILDNQIGYSALVSDNLLTNNSIHGYYSSDGSISELENWRCVEIDTTISKAIKLKVVGISSVTQGVLGFKADSSIITLIKDDYEGELLIPDDVVKVGVTSRALADDMYYCFSHPTIGAFINVVDSEVKNVSKDLDIATANKNESENLLTNNSIHGYYSSDGSISELENWRCVEVDTTVSKKIRLKGLVGGNTATTQVVIGFKSDDSVITLIEDYYEGELLIPDDVVKVGITSRALANDVYYCYTLYSEIKTIGEIIQEIKTEIKQIEVGDVSLIEKNNYYNKQWMFHGDSITYSGTNASKTGHIDRLVDRLGIIATNKGASGWSMTVTERGSIMARIKSVNYANIGITSIAAGTNDFKLNCAIGEFGSIFDADANYDTNTFYGAYRSALDYIISSNPKTEIILITPFHRDNSGYNIEYTNLAGHKLIDYVNAVRKIGEMYSLKVVDAYDYTGINTKNLAFYTTDGLHLNSDGYKLYADLLIKELVSFL